MANQRSTIWHGPNNKRFEKLRKTEARKRFNAGQTILVVGDNVNPYHFEDGWHLAIPMNKDDYDDVNRYNFDWRIQNFECYLERELGRRAAYFSKLS